VSWMPGLGGVPLLLTVFVALVLARQAFGGLGHNLFHPAAAGIAFALAAALAPLPGMRGDWVGAAWLLGGLVLLLLRIVRWQAPLFFLAGAAAAALARGHAIESLLGPTWILTAFFVAGDPVTSAEDARARALVAAAGGLLAGFGGIVVLPFALLAMNAASPLLDAAFDRARLKAQHA